MINKENLTWAAAFAKLSKALVIASVCCCWLLFVTVSIVSVFTLQSIRRLVVVVDADDDDDDDEGGERNTAKTSKKNFLSIQTKFFIPVDDVGDFTLDDDVRILCRVLCCWFLFSLSRLLVKLANNDVNGYIPFEDEVTN